MGLREGHKSRIGQPKNRHVASVARLRLPNRRRHGVRKMPEQQTLAIEPAATPAPAVPAAPAAKAPTPPRKFVLPAENTPAPEAPKAPEPKAASEPAEQAPAAEPEGDKPEEAETPEQAAKRQGRRFERRLDKAYRQRAEAEARAALLEKRIADLEKPKTPADDAAPRLDQFDYDPEKYATAKAEYEKNKALKAKEAEQRTEAAKARQDKLVASWEEKVEKAADKYDDFHTVVGELQPTNPLVAAIMAADPDVAYHLGKHSKEAERISSLDPIEQILEIGRLEGRLKAEAEKPKAPSKAPAPIKPLSGAGSTANDVPSETDDMGAWMKKREKQIAARRR